MIFKKDELRLLYPFYICYLLIGLSAVIIPFMIIYFQNLGFSFFQIGFLMGTFNFSMFFFEIPTGAMADSMSRRHSVMLGLLITSLVIFFMGIFKLQFFTEYP